MIRFEYTRGVYDDDSFDRMLASMGNEGWELAHVQSGVENRYGEQNYYAISPIMRHRCVFKRILPETTTVYDTDVEQDCALTPQLMGQIQDAIARHWTANKAPLGSPEPPKRTRKSK